MSRHYDYDRERERERGRERERWREEERHGGRYGERGGREWDRDKQPPPRGDHREATYARYGAVYGRPAVPEAHRAAAQAAARGERPPPGAPPRPPPPPRNNNAKAPRGGVRFAEGTKAGAGGRVAPPTNPLLGVSGDGGGGAGARGGLGSEEKDEPLALEELLARRRAEEAAQAKPTFMSKAERQKAALERRAAQVREQRARAAAASEAVRQGAGAGAGASFGGARGGAAPRGGERRAVYGSDEWHRQKTLEDIKKQYLEDKVIKSRGQRQAEQQTGGGRKGRFIFDWSAEEDTMREQNPQLRELQGHETSLMFGRGMRAGMDRATQRRALEAAARAAGRAAPMETEAAAEGGSTAFAKARRTYGDLGEAQQTHWTAKALSEMTQRDWRIFREDFNISTKSARGVLPMRNWAESGLSDPLMQAVEKVGYTKPSPIQMAAIPLGLAQRDVIGVAMTGSGKTCAFALPMLEYIRRMPPMDTEAIEAEGPYSLVMAPTRELAQQIEEETVKFAAFLNFRVVSVVGGISIEEQGFKLRRGCEIVIATPGRMADCLERQYAVLNQCNYVVLDEADRMLDMGFEPQIKAVLDRMPSTNLKPAEEDAALEKGKVYRTTYMFSATMPPTVERLARQYMRAPAVVTIGTVGRAADTVTQNVVMLKNHEKEQRLLSLLRGLQGEKVIVFTNTRNTCELIFKQLKAEGFGTTSLHGGKSQDAREASLRDFKNAQSPVLVATNVAGRGIDVADVAHVINYDMANDISDYTHRIGRTGRAGKKGAATTFLTPGDAKVYFALCNFLRQANQTVPSNLASHPASKKDPADKDKGMMAIEN